MTPSNANITLRIRLTTAKAINRAATMLFDLGIIEFSELQTVRAVMNSLADVEALMDVVEVNNEKEVKTSEKNEE